MKELDLNGIKLNSEDLAILRMLGYKPKGRVSFRRDNSRRPSCTHSYVLATKRECPLCGKGRTFFHKMEKRGRREVLESRRLAGRFILPDQIREDFIPCCAF